jgi:isopentenyl diphosphate isomerase/L-lactate dehydrogenase-like FMN-dependent dehydrogenase
VRIVEILRAELAAVMGMAGTGKISEIDASYVRLRK